MKRRRHTVTGVINKKGRRFEVTEVSERDTRQSSDTRNIGWAIISALIQGAAELKLSPAESATLIQICRYAGNGVSWPSEDTIAKAICVSRATVSRCKARLADKVGLRVETVRGAHGRHEKCIYDLSEIIQWVDGREEACRIDEMLHGDERIDEMLHGGMDKTGIQNRQNVTVDALEEEEEETKEEETAKEEQKNTKRKPKKKQPATLDESLSDLNAVVRQFRKAFGDELTDSVYALKGSDRDTAMAMLLILSGWCRTTSPIEDAVTIMRNGDAENILDPRAFLLPQVDVRVSPEDGRGTV